MKTKLIYEDTFDAAHLLPYHEGKCNNLHGHTWRVRIGIIGEVQEDGSMRGMVADFSVFKKAIQKYDHQKLNDFMKNPTAENIADEIFIDVASRLSVSGCVARVDFVEVWESPKACVRVESE